MQTEFDSGKGNALQACIGTILKVGSLADVPNFILAPNYLDAMNDYLGPLGYSFVKVDVSTTDGKLCFPVATGTRCVVTGKSPRGEHKHCVVGSVCADGKSFKLSHDPFPGGSGIEGSPVWVGFVCLK